MSKAKKRVTTILITLIVIWLELVSGYLREAKVRALIRAVIARHSSYTIF